MLRIPSWSTAVAFVVLALSSMPVFAAPFVWIGPDHDITLTAPATFSITANATPLLDGERMTSIEIRAGVFGKFTGCCKTLTQTFSNIGPGSYAFQAVGFSTRGSGASKSIVVTVVSPPSISLSVPSGDFVAPANVTLSAATSDSDGYVAKVDFYANGAWLGSDTSAPFELAWSNIGVGSYSVTAVATDNGGTTTTTPASGLSVRAPIANAQFVGQSVATFMQLGAQQTVTLQMRNTGDLTWSSANNYRLGSQNPSDNTTWGTSRAYLTGNVGPGQVGTFTFVINTPAAPGVYNFQWRMLQEGVLWFGDYTPNLQITVNAPPTVSLNPPAGNPFTAPATVNLSANAADSDGSITKVEFYSNGTLIGSDSSAPFTLTWNTVPAGAYTVTAKAYDNGGANRTSAPLSVSVNNALPLVSLAAPTGAPFIAPGTVGLAATASDPDGSIARVEFYAGGTLIGTDTGAPFQFNWSGVAAGTYSLTARAYDNTGAFTNSAAQNLTVVATQVKGNVDGVRQIGSEYRVYGWACSTGRTQSIAVHLYAGGGYGTGTLVGAYTANLASDATIASNCQAPGSAYRFDIPLTGAVRSAHGGKGIYIHGISPDGLDNLLVANSGTYSIPSLLALTRRYVYDGNQQLCKVIEPETGATVMEYDGTGNLLWSASGLNLTDPSNCNRAEAWASDRVVLREYFPRNTLKTLSFPDGRGDQSWTYTPDGLPHEVVTSNGAHGTEQVVNTYSYNRRRMLTGESSGQPGVYTWSIGYGYDGNGSLAALQYPTGLAIDYAPNALGQATQAGSYASGVIYHPNGAIQQFTYGNGIVHTMQQNARQLPARSADSGVLDLQNTYDANGNVTRIDDYVQGPGYGRTLEYDARDRLSAAGSPMFGGDGWHRFSYDSLDNLKSWTLAGVKDYATYYYDPGSNRLTNILNSSGQTIVGLGYDAQGNLTNRIGQAYDFDKGNRLRAVPGKETYRYDAYGRRVLNQRPGGAQTVSYYSQPGQLLYQEQTGKGTFEYIYLGGSLVATRNNAASGAQVQYQHTDALGSPVAITSAASLVIERTQYEPFGAAINKSLDGPGYTGHVMDAATGMSYMQQRYYDPYIGRFLSVDPVASNSRGGNFNRYRYANNNPYKYTDPDGRTACGQDWDCRTSTYKGGPSFSSVLVRTIKSDPQKYINKLNSTAGSYRYKTEAGAARYAANMLIPLTMATGREAGAYINYDGGQKPFSTSDYKLGGERNVGLTASSGAGSLRAIVHTHPTNDAVSGWRGIYSADPNYGYQGFTGLDANGNVVGTDTLVGIKKDISVYAATPNGSLTKFDGRGFNDAVNRFDWTVKASDHVELSP